MGWFNHQLVFFLNRYVDVYSTSHQKAGSYLKKTSQVGAPGDNDRGDFSGAAYVFLRKADSFMEQVGGGPPEKCFTKDLGLAIPIGGCLAGT